jgi:hypothetical protein
VRWHSLFSTGLEKLASLPFLLADSADIKTCAEDHC